MFLKKIKNLSILFLLLFISMPTLIYAYSDYVIASGENIGVKINSNGVLVVGLYEINNTYPAKDSGIKIGDLIVSVNDNNVTNIEELINEFENSDNIKIGYIRNNKKYYTNIKLYKDNDNYKTGMYVKDNITGIGTLTYIDPNTKIFGALGHEIIEKTTGKILNIKDGQIYNSKVTSITKSEKGIPGSKNAKLDFNNVKGNIDKNTKEGIFGEYISNIDNSKLYKVSKIDDIKLGKAKILTVIKDNTVEEFDINIIKVSDNDTKSILFELIDENLLEKANGIVQGMSGSPIIQGNNIIGAVTHVVVDNPKRGYGILITNMLEQGEN